MISNGSTENAKHEIAETKWHSMRMQDKKITKLCAKHEIAVI